MHPDSCSTKEAVLMVARCGQVLGQKKVREARQLGWTLLRAARLREGPKPPEGYFRYHRTPQFEVLISGLLGVVCTYVKGHAGAPGTLHVAAQPASGLPVPVWGDKNWVIREWRMSGTGCFRCQQLHSPCCCWRLTQCNICRACVQQVLGMLLPYIYVPVNSVSVMHV